MRLVLEIILALLVINYLFIDKVLAATPLRELKRRARASHDRQASKIYKMAAYGRTLDIILWLKGSVSAGLFFFLVLASSWPLAIVFAAVLIFALRFWQPAADHGLLWGWTAAVAPAYAWGADLVQPLFSRFGAQRHNHKTPIYEKEDLVEFLKRQSQQAGNRIPEAELKMAAGALNFGAKKVAEVMTPLRKSHPVSEDEQVGPLLMDELHQTGFSYFPVVRAADQKTANPEVVGTLFLQDIILNEGRARELMHKKVSYINESQTLREALAAILKTHHHLLIVVNNFEETVGVLGLDAIVEQILGQRIIDELEDYENARVVAGYDDTKDKQKPKPEPTPEAPAEA